MFKHIVILGFLFMAIGGLSLAWVYYSPNDALTGLPSNESPNEIAVSAPDWPPLNLSEPNELDQRLAQLNNKSSAALMLEQQARLKADLSSLAVSDTNDAVLKEKLYGENWQKEVQHYKQRGELREFILTTSIVLTVIGSVIFVGCFCLVGVRLFLRAFRRIFLKNTDEDEHDLNQETLTSTPVKKPQPSIAPQVPYDPLTPVQRPQLKKDRSHLGKRSRVAVHYDMGQSDIHSENNCSLEYQRVYPSFDDFYFNDNYADNEALAGLLCDEDSLPLSQRSSHDSTVFQNVNTETETETNRVVSVCTESNIAEEIEAELEVESPEEPPPELDESITSQTEDLAKQIAQVQVLAQTTSQTSGETSGPIIETLQQLSEQISAIRQYAASQQNRVEKLQSGYDWNIIRTFCLRFIRCIDNLDNRIARLEQEDVETDYLRDVRDELLFALESSGVEQYEPEPGSLFRGQERIAEVVKEKEPCSDPDKRGTIAAVVKPGYQYLIDDENVKVVRTARVKLYD